MNEPFENDIIIANPYAVAPAQGIFHSGRQEYVYSAGGAGARRNPGGRTFVGSYLWGIYQAFTSQ